MHEKIPPLIKVLFQSIYTLLPENCYYTHSSASTTINNLQTLQTRFDELINTFIQELNPILQSGDQETINGIKSEINRRLNGLCKYYPHAFRPGQLNIDRLNSILLRLTPQVNLRNPGESSLRVQDLELLTQSRAVVTCHPPDDPFDSAVICVARRRANAPQPAKKRLYVVLDVSGSMGGGRLNLANAALKHLRERYPELEIHVIAFTDKATHQIYNGQSFAPIGCTNVPTGLHSMGEYLLDFMEENDDALGSVLVISDGESNYEPDFRAILAAWEKRGINIGKISDQIRAGKPLTNVEILGVILQQAFAKFSSHVRFSVCGIGDYAEPRLVGLATELGDGYHSGFIAVTDGDKIPESVERIAAEASLLIDGTPVVLPEHVTCVDPRYVRDGHLSNEILINDYALVLMVSGMEWPEDSPLIVSTPSQLLGLPASEQVAILQFLARWFQRECNSFLGRAAAALLNPNSSQRTQKCQGYLTRLKRLIQLFERYISSVRSAGEAPGTNPYLLSRGCSYNFDRKKWLISDEDYHSLISLGYELTPNLQWIEPDEVTNKANLSIYRCNSLIELATLVNEFNTGSAILRLQINRGRSDSQQAKMLADDIAALLETLQQAYEDMEKNFFCLREKPTPELLKLLRAPTIPLKTLQDLTNPRLAKRNDEFAGRQREALSAYNLMRMFRLLKEHAKRIPDEINSFVEQNAAYSFMDAINNFDLSIQEACAWLRAQKREETPENILAELFFNSRMEYDDTVPLEWKIQKLHSMLSILGWVYLALPISTTGDDASSYFHMPVTALSNDVLRPWRIGLTHVNTILCRVEEEPDMRVLPGYLPKSIQSTLPATQTGRLVILPFWPEEVYNPACAASDLWRIRTLFRMLMTLGWMGRNEPRPADTLLAMRSGFTGTLYFLQQSGAITETFNQLNPAIQSQLVALATTRRAFSPKFSGFKRFLQAIKALDQLEPGQHFIKLLGELLEPRKDQTPTLAAPEQTVPEMLTYVLSSAFPHDEVSDELLNKIFINLLLLVLKWSPAHQKNIGANLMWRFAPQNFEELIKFINTLVPNITDETVMAAPHLPNKPAGIIPTTQISHLLWAYLLVRKIREKRHELEVVAHRSVNLAEAEWLTNCMVEIHHEITQAQTAAREPVQQTIMRVAACHMGFEHHENLFSILKLCLLKHKSGLTPLLTSWETAKTYVASGRHFFAGVTHAIHGEDLCSIVNYINARLSGFEIQGEAIESAIRKYLMEAHIKRQHMLRTVDFIEFDNEAPLPSIFRVHPDGGIGVVDGYELRCVAAEVPQEDPSTGKYISRYKNLGTDYYVLDNLMLVDIDGNNIAPTSNHFASCIRANELGGLVAHRGYSFKSQQLRNSQGEVIQDQQVHLWEIRIINRAKQEQVDASDILAAYSPEQKKTGKSNRVKDANEADQFKKDFEEGHLYEFFLSFLSEEEQAHWPKRKPSGAKPRVQESAIVVQQKLNARQAIEFKLTMTLKDFDQALTKAKSEQERAEISSEKDVAIAAAALEIDNLMLEYEDLPFPLVYSDGTPYRQVLANPEAGFELIFVDQLNQEADLVPYAGHYVLARSDDGLAFAIWTISNAGEKNGNDVIITEKELATMLNLAEIPMGEHRKIIRSSYLTALKEYIKRNGGKVLEYSDAIRLPYSIVNGLRVAWDSSLSQAVVSRDSVYAMMRTIDDTSSLENWQNAAMTLVSGAEPHHIAIAERVLTLFPQGVLNQDLILQLVSNLIFERNLQYFMQSSLWEGGHLDGMAHQILTGARLNNIGKVDSLEKLNCKPYSGSIVLCSTETEEDGYDSDYGNYFTQTTSTDFLIFVNKKGRKLNCIQLDYRQAACVKGMPQVLDLQQIRTLEQSIPDCRNMPLDCYVTEDNSAAALMVEVLNILRELLFTQRITIAQVLTLTEDDFAFIKSSSGFLLQMLTSTHFSLGELMASQLIKRCRDNPALQARLISEIKTIAKLSSDQFATLSEFVDLVEAGIVTCETVLSIKLPNQKQAVLDYCHDKRTRDTVATKGLAVSATAFIFFELKRFGSTIPEEQIFAIAIQDRFLLAQALPQLQPRGRRIKPEEANLIFELICNSKNAKYSLQIVRALVFAISFNYQSSLRTSVDSNGHFRFLLQIIKTNPELANELGIACRIFNDGTMSKTVEANCREQFKELIAQFPGHAVQLATAFVALLSEENYHYYHAPLNTHLLALTNNPANALDYAKKILTSTNRRPIIPSDYRLRNPIFADWLEIREQTTETVMQTFQIIAERSHITFPFDLGIHILQFLPIGRTVFNDQALYMPAAMFQVIVEEIFRELSGCLSQALRYLLGKIERFQKNNSTISSGIWQSETHSLPALYREIQSYLAGELRWNESDLALYLIKQCELQLGDRYSPRYFKSGWFSEHYLKPWLQNIEFPRIHDCNERYPRLRFEKAPLEAEVVNEGTSEPAKCLR